MENLVIVSKTPSRNQFYAYIVYRYTFVYNVNPSNYHYEASNDLLRNAALYS